MGNKNFEKKKTNSLGGFHDPHAVGYNTCLDRTNAKGIYEAAKELLIRIDYLNEIHDIKLPDSVAQLAGELQTELKKAEEHGVDKRE